MRRGGSAARGVAWDGLAHELAARIAAKLVADGVVPGDRGAMQVQKSPEAVLPSFDADAVLDLLPSSTVLMGVPTFYTRLLASPRLDAEVTASMRLFVAGSAPLLAHDHQ